jgi:LysM repeat protein
VNRVWAARVAAPAAFLAGVTLAVLLVRAGLDGEATTTAATTSPTVIVQEPATTTAARPQQRVFATVAEGDTLAEIASEHDTTIERLLDLNPALDPTNLQIGQRVRVR